MHPGPSIIVALDFPSQQAALALAKRLDPMRCRVKVGKQLFTAAGPAVIERLHRMGFEVFLDLKFHDQPDTVTAAVRAACGLGVWMLDVHAFGGEKMLRAAASVVKKRSRPRPSLVAVTLLTGLQARDLYRIGLSGSPEMYVHLLAGLAHECGFDGVVCSGGAALSLRHRHGPDFVLVTPGVRREGDARNDQERTVTPEVARENGVSYLVVGRPITRAVDPARAAEDFLQRIARPLPTPI